MKLGGEARLLQRIAVAGKMGFHISLQNRLLKQIEESLEDPLEAKIGGTGFNWEIAVSILL